MPHGGTGAGTTGGRGMFGIQVGYQIRMPYCMVAVLATNLAPNMGQYLPPSANGAFLVTKMEPSIGLSRATAFITCHIEKSSKVSLF